MRSDTGKGLLKFFIFLIKNFFIFINRTKLWGYGVKCKNNYFKQNNFSDLFL